MKDKRFLAAVAIAAIFGMERMGLRDYLKAGWGVLRAMTMRHKNPQPEIHAKRIAHCEQCALYYAPLGTCNSPLADSPEMGCWCHMKTKAQDPKATCWADDNTDLNIGWKSANL
jgi:hypothetical protein